MKVISLFCVIVIGLQACNTLQDLAAYDPYTQPTATTSSPRSTAAAQPSQTATPQICTVIAAEALNLRAGPGLNYSVIAWLRAGEVLTLTNEPARGAWWEVISEAGARGWINSEYCQ